MISSVEAGKFHERNGRLYMPLSITCHHAASDGWHVSLFLDARQMEVSVLQNVAKAKEVLMKSRPSLLIIDKQLPDGCGDELCRWGRRLWGDPLPILYLTVEGETKDIVQGFSDGVDEYNRQMIC